MDAIEKNITETIMQIQKDGTTGMALSNLRQITPTTGVTVPVHQYGEMFQTAALKIGKKLKFPIF